VTSPAAPSSEPSELPLDVLVSQTLGEDLTGQLTGLLPVLVQDLADIDRRMRDVLGATFPRLTDAATYACSAGGKRVRPVLMAALHRAIGAQDTTPIHSLAAAFQLIHTATLVHDDVIDHAEMRRGRPSLPQAFGLPLAIVSGDYLFVRAFELASEYPRSIIMRCGEACADLVEGEVLQESGRFDLTAGPEHYYRVVERKTAAIVAASLASVAEIAGASTPVLDAASAYGRALGVAFQIRDDILDVYGDSDILGKPLYGDFREGNPTLLSLETFERLDGNRRAEFERLFVQRRKQPGDLLRLRALVDAAGAAPRVEETARQWAERATRALEVLPASPYKILLEHMAWGAAERRF
jgi:geranylgeranyl pyrophosphate synthase